MKHIVTILALSLTLFSCKSFRGNLSTTSELTLKDKKSTVKIPVGEHSLKVSFSSKRKGKFEVLGKKVNFKLKKGVKLPSEGRFCLLEDQWDQNFEACGEIVAEVSYGPLRHEWEGCTYQVPRTICEGGGRNRRCYTVYDTYHGQRHVEFRMKETIETIDLDLAQSGATSGTFHARNIYNDKMIERQGICR